jgi:hypothetical protein
MNDAVNVEVFKFYPGLSLKGKEIGYDSADSMGLGLHEI